MKIQSLLLLMSLPLLSSDGETSKTQTAQESQSLTQSLSPKLHPRERTLSVVHISALEDVQQQLNRTRVEHERKERLSRFKICTAFLTAAASVVGGTAAVMYAVSKCDNQP